jgi:hypothetical protein
MVLEFIKAEVDSPRFSRFYPPDLREKGATRSRLIDNPDLLDAPDNARRRELLAYRGYGSRTELFAALPSDAIWRWERWTPAELEQMKYAQLRDTTVWMHLSADTRLVSVAVRKLRDGPPDAILARSEIADAVRIRIRAIVEQIRSVAALYDRGSPMLPPIAVTDESDLVLLEGHVRVTAFALAATGRPLEMLVGHSPVMRRWQLF